MKGLMVLIQEKKAFAFLESKINSALSAIELLESKIKDIEEDIKVIRPDDVDVYNINRRIEVLAQRIATLESGKKGWLK